MNEYSSIPLDERVAISLRVNWENAEKVKKIFQKQPYAYVCNFRLESNGDLTAYKCSQKNGVYESEPRDFYHWVREHNQVDTQDAFMQILKEGFQYPGQYANINVYVYAEPNPLEMGTIDTVFRSNSNLADSSGDGYLLVLNKSIQRDQFVSSYPQIFERGKIKTSIQICLPQDIRPVIFLNKDLDSNQVQYRMDSYIKHIPDYFRDKVLFR